MQDSELRKSTRTYYLVTAYSLSAIGLLVGGGYYVWLAFDHQSFGPDAQLLVVVGAVVWLPVTLVMLAPAVFLYPVIGREPQLRRKCLLSTAAGVLPLAMIAFGIVSQGTDWDELLLFIIPFAPTVLALIVVVIGTRGT